MEAFNSVDLKLVKLSYLSLLPLYLYYRSKLKFFLHMFYALVLMSPLYALGLGPIILLILIAVLLFAFWWNRDEIEKLKSTPTVAALNLNKFDGIFLVIYLISVVFVNNFQG